MSSSRIAAFVSGGPIALQALEALAAGHRVVVIVRPAAVRSLRAAWRGPALRVARALGVRPADPVVAWARRAGIPIIESAAGHESRDAARLASFAPDIGCIATFPRKVPSSLRAAAGRDCLNLHPSLLPRHRGANPLFWTYHAGDLQGGVSVHVATDRFDAGPVILRSAFDIARGESVVDVHARCAVLGAQLLARAVAQLATGTAVREAQDEGAATRAPSVGQGRVYSDLVTWGCAQAWHFLAGMVARYQEPFVDTAGRVVRYRRVEGFEERPPRFPPGSVVRDGAGWSAWTPDGVVHLSRGSGT